MTYDFEYKLMNRVIPACWFRCLVSDRVLRILRVWCPACSFSHRESPLPPHFAGTCGLLGELVAVSPAAEVGATDDLNAAKILRNTPYVGEEAAHFWLENNFGFQVAIDALLDALHNHAAIRGLIPRDHEHLSIAALREFFARGRALQTTSVQRFRSLIVGKRNIASALSNFIVASSPAVQKTSRPWGDGVAAVYSPEPLLAHGHAKWQVKKRIYAKSREFTMTKLRESSKARQADALRHWSPPHNVEECTGGRARASQPAQANPAPASVWHNLKRLDHLAKTILSNAPNNVLSSGVFFKELYKTIGPEQASALREAYRPPSRLFDDLSSVGHTRTGISSAIVHLVNTDAPRTAQPVRSEGVAHSHAGSLLDTMCRGGRHVSSECIMPAARSKPQALFLFFHP